MKPKTNVLLLCLALLGMPAQVIPFVVFPVPGGRNSVGALPPNSPPEYTASDYAKARALDQALSEVVQAADKNIGRDRARWQDLQKQFAGRFDDSVSS